MGGLLGGSASFGQLAPRAHQLGGLSAASPLRLRAFGAGGDPRAHLNPDGTKPETEDAEGYHDPDPLDHSPKPLLVKERGRTFVKSQDPPKSSGELYGIRQNDLPFWPRHRLYIWGNYKLLMKAEYLFFYIPAFTTIYALEDVAATTKTIKV